MENLKVTYHNLSELIPDPDNVRRHDRRNIDAIKDSISKFGIRKPIVVHEKSKIIYAGNGVYEAAKELGITEVPVAWIPADTPSEVAKAFAIYDNRTNELSDWEPQKLDKLLSELPDINLDELLWTPAEYDELLASLETENVKKEETFDVGAAMEAETEPISKMGDVWICGKHRMKCGDSTKAEDVEKLFIEHKASMIWTDPPYGVHYGEKLDISNPMGYRVRSIQGDDKSPVELEKLIRSAYIIASDHSIPGANIYAASPAGTLLPVAIAAFSGSGFDFHWQLVWVKDSLVLSRADYHFRYENILYGWKPDGAHYFVDDRKQDSVFEVPRPRKSEEHPTMKPIELVETMIQNSSHYGDIVYDPFLGSGTTLIASQNTGRICFGMEISCAYTDVCCRRFYDFTGIIPTLEATGEPFPIDKK